MARQRRPRGEIVTDPTGELHDGIPTYIWSTAPPGLLTRRQLAAKGLRIGGQPVAAQVLRGEFLYARLYREDLAKPQFAKTPAKQAAVWTAARSRRVCVECGPVDYIPRQAAPAWGRCWDCVDAREARQEGSEAA